jgi:deazaflavin-dependent oxidoreductase (nitroreductase family)
MGWAVGLGLAAIGAVAALGGVYFVGMRTKNRWVQGAVIAFTKRVVNPRMLPAAGTPGAYAALIRHIGRASGRPYATPVGAVPVDGGFVVSLPYGRRPNWLRNVLAAGGATLVHGGVEYRVDRPEVVPLEPFARSFDPSDQKLHRLFGMDEVLRLRLGESDTTGGATVHAAA